MTTTAIILMVLFIAIIWGGLIVSVAMLRGTNDDIAGELGEALGTDDATLAGLTR